MLIISSRITNCAAFCAELRSVELSESLAVLRLGIFPILIALFENLVFFPASLFLFFTGFVACVIVTIGLKEIFSKYIIRDCPNELFSAVYSQTQAVLE